MAVFNLATAALILQKNNISEFISFTEFALSITDLCIYSLIIILALLFFYGSKFYFLFLPLSLISVVNITFSSFIINYYINNKHYNEQFLNLCIAIIVINALSLSCSCKFKSNDNEQSCTCNI